MKKALLFLFVVAFCCTTPSLWAGPELARSQTDLQVEEDIGAIYPPDGKETAPPPAPVQPKFRASVSGAMEYMTNARRSGSHGSDDIVWTPTIELGYATPLGYGFSFESIARIDTSFFTEHDDLSFGGYSGAMFLDYRCRANLPRLYLGSEAYRFEQRFGDRMTQAAVPKIGLDHGIAFNGNRSAVFFGYDYGIYLASPDLDSRDTHRWIAGVTHQATASLFLQTFYSFQFTDYDEYDRADSRNLVALNVIYQFTPHFFGTLTTGYVHNHSTFDAASYENVNTGLTFSFQF